MKNFIEKGDTVKVAAPSGGVVAGAFVVVGALFGVAVNDAAEAADVILHRRGVFTLPKVTGTAWTKGDQLYWDASAGKFTKAAANSMSLGVAFADAASGDAIGQVDLNTVPGPGVISPLTAVADLTENAGAIGGSNDGNMPDLAATYAAPTVNDGSVAVTATDGTTPGAAALKSDVDARLVTLDANDDAIKVSLVALAADVADCTAGIRELAAKLNTALARLRSANIITD